MPPEDDLDKALLAVDAQLKDLSNSPEVVEIKTERAFDANGNAAAFISVIVRDPPSGDVYPWGKLKPIHDLIWSQFAAHHVASLPYVEFHLQSEGWT